MMFSDSISPLPFSIAFVNPRVTDSNLLALPPAVSPSIRKVSMVFPILLFITGSNICACRARVSNWNGVVAAVSFNRATSLRAPSAPRINGVKAASASSILANCLTRSVAAPTADAMPTLPHLKAALVPATKLRVTALAAFSNRFKSRTAARVNRLIRLVILSTGAVTRSIALNTVSMLNRLAIPYPFDFGRVCSLS